jgi:predicted nucleic acid-binding protein
MTLLLDTNIVLEHLRSGLLNQANPDVDFAVSVITVTELLRYPGLGREELGIIETFLSITRLIPIDSTIARRAASIGKTRKTKLPDLLIAATAIQHNIPLITKNVKDFIKIPKLVVRDNL